MILCWRLISARNAISSAPVSGKGSSVIMRLGVLADGDPGERLVDVYAAELLAVTAETDCIAGFVNFFDAVFDVVLVYLDLAQNAIVSQNHLWKSDLGMDIVKSLKTLNLLIFVCCLMVISFHMERQ